MATALLDVHLEAVADLRDTRKVQDEYPAALSLERPIYANGTPYRRQWELSWSLQDRATTAAIEAMFDLTAGGADIFQWQPPGEAGPIDVRFLDGVMTIAKRSHHLGTMSITVEEWA